MNTTTIQHGLPALKSSSLPQENILLTSGLSFLIISINPKDIRSVKDKSRRPKRVRKPKWPYELVKIVKELQRPYSRWETGSCDTYSRAGI